MTFRNVTPTFAVAPQIDERQIQEAVADGFIAIINNRPDGEEACQPHTQDLRAISVGHGLAYLHLPIIGSAISDDDVTAFNRALEDSPGRVLAFCRTGTRSVTLWALSRAGQLSVDEIVGAAAAAGYDLSGLRPRLDHAQGHPS